MGPENPFKGTTYLLIVDKDGLSILDRDPILRSLLEKVASWMTGPRCEGKKLEVLGEAFRCTECGTEFRAEETKRGSESYSG